MGTPIRDKEWDTYNLHKKYSCGSGYRANPADDSDDSISNHENHVQIHRT